jgi:hypothetical protein
MLPVLLAFVLCLVYAQLRNWRIGRIYGPRMASLSLQVRSARGTLADSFAPLEFCKLECFAGGILLSHSHLPHWVAVLMQSTLIPYDNVVGLSASSDTLQLKWTANTALHILDLHWPPGGGDDGVGFCQIVRKRMKRPASAAT